MIDADFVTPPAEAVIAAVPGAETDEIVPLKLPVADPVGMDTLVGAVTCALLLERSTKSPPAGAAALSVMAQEKLPGAAKVAGEHVRPVGVVVDGRMVMSPPEPVVRMTLPVPLAVAVPLIWIAVELDLLVDKSFTAI